MTLNELLENVKFNSALGICVEKEGMGELLDINEETKELYGDCTIGAIWAYGSNEIYVDINLKKEV